MPHAASPPGARGSRSDSPVIGAELIWAARHEMAETLCDAVLRRTPLGSLGYPGDEAASRAADLLGTERGGATSGSARNWRR